MCVRASVCVKVRACMWCVFACVRVCARVTACVVVVEVEVVTMIMMMFGTHLTATLRAIACASPSPSCPA